MNNTDHNKTRYCIPTKYDQAPFGTLYEVINEQNTSEHYIQLSEDPLSPSWQKVGFLFEKVFDEFLQDEEFLVECLTIYLDKQKILNGDKQ